MNPLDNLVSSIETIIGGDPILSSAIPAVPGWIDYGLPLESGPFPCIRMDGLVAFGDRQNRHYVNVKLWSQDMTHQFFTTVYALEKALSLSDQFQVQGYSHQPEEGLNCALFQVTFVP